MGGGTRECRGGVGGGGSGWSLKEVGVDPERSGRGNQEVWEWSQEEVGSRGSGWSQEVGGV